MLLCVHNPNKRLNSIVYDYMQYKPPYTVPQPAASTYHVSVQYSFEAFLVCIY